jgi:glutamate/tyrosine decarboxylase-like PLP-dependent enzyme
MTNRSRNAFPKGGATWETLQREMRERCAHDFDFRHGRTSIFFFYSDQETYEIGKKAYFEHFSENALGNGRAYPGLGTMEQDVLDYGLDLLSAPDSAKGVFTTGGTESIFLSMKAAREAYRAKKPGSEGKRLNIVMPVTGHPAFDKSAIVMDIDIRRAPLGENRRVDTKALADLIDENTMAIVGSAPCFPHGVIDPISELSKIALERDVWLHIDSCVGGWIAPFFKRIGRKIPDFDLSLPGVRSISADLHKFGFCPKPASTVFFRNEEDIARSTFRLDGWTSGVYVTATFCGTRPGAAVAAAWSVLNHMGRTGFEDVARRMAAMADKYVAGIEAIDGLKMIAKPDLTVLNFGSDDVDIYAVAQLMKDKGWFPGLTREPKGMQTMLSMQHDPVSDDYLRDLRASVEAARTGKTQTTIKATY